MALLNLFQHRDLGAACYLPNSIHVVNNLQGWVSGKVSQIRAESPAGSLRPSSLYNRAQKALRWNIPSAVSEVGKETVNLETSQT